MKKLVLFLFIFIFATGGYSKEVHHIGVNVPWRDHEIGMKRVFPIIGQLGLKFYRHAMYADVGWIHIEPQDNDWHFEYSDSAVFNPYGITPLLTLYHCCNSSDTIGIQVPWRACFDDGCGWYLSDSTDSKDYVQTVVNRYKSVTKYWEISNELDGNQHRPQGLPANFVATFLKVNYPWIKAADPEAKVIQPSLSGTYGMPLGAYNWLKIILLHGACNYFDILGYHDYNSWWTLPAHVDSIKKAMQEFSCPEKPFWVTECSISSDSTTNITPRYSSIDQQAADVWRRSSVLFAYGVEKFFWHPLWSGSHRPWIAFGLLDKNGKKKKSFYSYQLLIDEVDTFQTAKALSFGEVTNDNEHGGDGIWVVQYTFANGDRKWVLWSPNNQSYTLTIPQYKRVEVINTVPAFISYDGEQASFSRDTLQVINGKLTFHLNDIPILVKGLTTTGIGQLKGIPQKFKLYPNYPNPFNPMTTIRYSIGTQSLNAQKVNLTVYNTLGKKVATLVNEKQKPGDYSVTFDGSRLPSGIYFFSLKAGSFVAAKKMILLK